MSIEYQPLGHWPGLDVIGSMATTDVSAPEDGNGDGRGVRCCCCGEGGSEDELMEMDVLRARKLRGRFGSRVMSSSDLLLRVSVCFV